MKRISMAAAMTAFFSCEAASLCAPLVPYRVKDIEPGPESSSPRAMAAVGDKLFFNAIQAANGATLWVSDGTPAGTQLVKDFDPGFTYTAIMQPQSLNGQLLFMTHHSTTDEELWISDGSSTGTQSLLHPNAGFNDSIVRILGVAGYTAYIQAETAGTSAIWKTDGTVTGTTLVKDLTPVTFAAGVSTSGVVNNKLVVRCSSADNGSELWTSNGTAAGTQLLKDIYPGANSSFAEYFTPMGSTALFTASSASGKGLWKTDGRNQASGSERFRWTSPVRRLWAIISTSEPMASRMALACGRATEPPLGRYLLLDREAGPTSLI
jgi:trimeric autotransporter adhesin